VISAKEAHRLSQEQYERGRRDALETDLAAIERRVQSAIRRGRWSCDTGIKVGEMRNELTDALVAFGYTVGFGKRNRTSPVTVSWGAPKAMRGGL
jgi:hypothetical protein